MIWTAVYLGLGSNLGDRRAQLQSAIDALRAHTCIRVVGISSIYETAPVGEVEQPHFLNAVVAALLSDSVEELHKITQTIERAAGRQREREQRWGPRRLDIDILNVAYHEIFTPKLTIPHPRMAERAFVLIPLAELAPHLLIPSLGQVEALALQAGGDGVERYPNAQLK